MYFKLVESLDLKAESSSLLTFDFQLLTEERWANRQLTSLFFQKWFIFLQCLFKHFYSLFHSTVKFPSRRIEMPAAIEKFRS